MLLWKAYVVCIFTKTAVWEQRNMRCCCPSALFKSHQSSTSEVSFFLFLELFAFLAFHHSTLFHQGISALLYVNQQQWYQQHLCANSLLALWQSQAKVFQSPFFLMFWSQSNRWGKMLFRCWSFCPTDLFQKEIDVAIFQSIGVPVLPSIWRRH